MKKTVFLIIPAMVILLSGCTTSNHGYFESTGNRHALINSNTRTPLYADSGPGLYLPISRRSSVNIDVEGILDYMQGGPIFGIEYERNDLRNPWIRLNVSY